ncbi:hypothetical protein B0H19DRAFT_374158 [Mycena capillaripes]|nr:hypothetical protein B0H19DRAFT_374158 [Mycena capillaripes]
MGLTLNTPVTTDADGTLEVTWTTVAGDPTFALELNGPINIDVATGLAPAALKSSVGLGQIPPGTYTLQAVVGDDIEKVIATSGSFTIAATPRRRCSPRRSRMPPRRRRCAPASSRRRQARHRQSRPRQERQEGRQARGEPGPRGRALHRAQRRRRRHQGHQARSEPDPRGGALDCAERRHLDDQGRAPHGVGQVWASGFVPGLGVERSSCG